MTAAAREPSAARIFDDGPPLAASAQALSAQALSALALRLAVGDERASAEVRAWRPLLELMRRERLAVLAWVRCGATIRALADPQTVTAWRFLWAEAALRGHAALEAYAEAAGLLARHGVVAVALKGAPLAQALYGEPAARCSDDVDCFVPRADRLTAERLLRGQGWRVILGSPRADQTFCRLVDGHVVRLELHSSLLSERLTHLPAPAPQHVTRTIGGRSLAVFEGPMLPAYLAAHLATHVAPPLLWWLDFQRVWSGLSESDQATSRDAARDAGLARYLGWAARRAAAIEGAVGGDALALSRLGLHVDGRRDRHELWRHVTLAPDAAAARRAIVAWVRPPWAAERDGGLIVGTLRRAGRHWRRLLPGYAGRVGPPRGTPKSVVTLDGSALLSVAEEITGQGGEFQIALTGRSMEPALAPGDRLVLALVPDRLRRGDIVLANVLGSPVVHRIVRAVHGQGQVTMRGDACASDDPPVPSGALVSRVVASERGAVWSAHVVTLRFGVLAMVRGLRYRARARLAHGWRGLRARSSARRAFRGRGAAAEGG